MNGKITALIAIVGALAVLALLVLYGQISDRRASQSASTWTTGWGLGGVDLQLYEDGRFIQHAWCDICPDEIVRGTWKLSPPAQQITVDLGDSIRNFGGLRMGDCEFLIDMRYVGSDGAVQTGGLYQRSLAETQGCRYRFHLCQEERSKEESCRFELLPQEGLLALLSRSEQLFNHDE